MPQPTELKQSNTTRTLGGCRLWLRCQEQKSSQLLMLTKAIGKSNWMMRVQNYVPLTRAQEGTGLRGFPSEYLLP